MRCLGVILAGGLARRMGGIDKPLIAIAGKPILSRLIERLGPQCDGLALNANGDPARFARFGLPVVADSVEGFAGPLAGVLAGMDYAAARFPEFTDIVSVPGDTPFIPTDLVMRFYEVRKERGAEIVVAASQGRAHHAVALWPLTLRDALRQALVEAGERKVSAFIARFPNAAESWDAEHGDPFFNLNRPEDMARTPG